MQSVADRLDSSASALYRYFANRDDLVAAAMEELLQTDPIPVASRGWREFLLAEAELRWRLLSTTAGLAAFQTNRAEMVAAKRMHRLVASLQERLRAGPPDVAAALERIIADPRAHVMRKIALVLDGLEARVQLGR